MNGHKTEQEAGRPIQLALDLLVDAQKHTESFRADSVVDMQFIIKSISEAKSILVKGESKDSMSNALPIAAGNAMNHLRNVLERLQEGNPEDAAVVSTTKILAKTLAVLYPISKILENPSRVPDHPSSAVTEPPGVDRRTAKRMAIEADIGFQSETNFFMGFTEDISTGGLFIATYDTRDIGSHININFTLPNGYLVSAEGIVRWVREYNETTPDTMPGMGVQFEGLPEKDKVAIHGFIAERPPIFYEE
ncbi:MAG: TIGR02266 family protein [Deltaproteobacteria bacterium]|nr:TIGR02266 family protein [Deltaproteobacteria bacterium]